jgi:hypothetical protein
MKKLIKLEKNMLADERHITIMLFMLLLKDFARFLLQTTIRMLMSIEQKKNVNFPCFPLWEWGCIK